MKVKLVEKEVAYHLIIEHSQCWPWYYFFNDPSWYGIEDWNDYWYVTILNRAIRRIPQDTIIARSKVGRI